MPKELEKPSYKPVFASFIVFVPMLALVILAVAGLLESG
jgi:hypothetical protein